MALYPADCCGIGILEVKCPFKFKDTGIMAAIKDKEFCLYQDHQDGIKLKSKHPYYYQVQQQLHICKEQIDRRYSDFVEWMGMYQNLL